MSFPQEPLIPEHERPLVLSVIGTAPEASATLNVSPAEEGLHATPVHTTPIGGAMSDVAKPSSTPEHGNMTRDDRDEWPADEPIGSFDIDVNEHGIQGYPGAKGHMLFVCPNGHRCGVLVGPAAVTRPSEDKACVWGWDGNIDRPTITPSINCIAEKDGKPTGGCGWHGFITAGVMR